MRQFFFITLQDHYYYYYYYFNGKRHEVMMLSLEFTIFSCTVMYLVMYLGGEGGGGCIIMYWGFTYLEGKFELANAASMSD